MKNGTLIFTEQAGPVVNGITGLEWTHVLIYFNGLYYEATFPKVKKGTKYRWRKRLILQPQREWNFDKMLEYSKSQLGRLYQCIGFFHPGKYGKTKGIYCSEYVCYALRAGGVPIHKIAGHSPDVLLESLKLVGY